MKISRALSIFALVTALTAIAWVLISRLFTTPPVTQFPILFLPYLAVAMTALTIVLWVSSSRKVLITSLLIVISSWSANMCSVLFSGEGFIETYRLLFLALIFATLIPLACLIHMLKQHFAEDSQRQSRNPATTQTAV